MTADSISSLTVAHAQEFQRHLPGIRDGDAEAVHQARVSTRRLRELLAVLMSQEPRARGARRLMRKAGRELGRVRELDVMSTMLAREERLNPAAMLAIVVARRTLGERLTAARRRMVTRIERLDLGDLPEHLRLRDGPIDWIRDRYAVRSTWGQAFSKRLARRAGHLAQAVDDAGGVYFPKRLHEVRVSAKKLRYTLEMASAVGIWRPPHMLKDLRGAQTILGDLHDVQVLVDEMDDLVADDRATSERATLAATLRARAEEYHQKYLETRDRLSTIAEVVERFSRRANHRGRLTVVVESAARTTVHVLVHQINPRALLRS
jgi:CHAD domain-containing protein